MDLQENDSENERENDRRAMMAAAAGLVGWD
jgi:hypothetical protein